MVYSVPESKRSIKQNQFEFTFPGEKKIYSVPKAQFISPSIFVDLDPESNDLQVASAILRSVFENDNVLRKFEDAEQLKAWFAAWQEASDITLGESEASLI